MSGAAYLPERCIALLRLSDLRAEDLDDDGVSRGLATQEQDVREYAERLGWTIPPGFVIVENDLVRGADGKVRGVSAFRRRKITLPDGRTELRTVRPGFRKALRMLASGEADGLLTLDLDRTVRDPRDLEDLVDVVEASRRRIPVDSVSGSLKLYNDSDVTMARLNVSMGNKSSRDTARRVRRARRRQAETGKFGGGMRPFGFEPDGLTIREAEAKLIESAAVRLVQGVSLRSLAAELRDAGVPTVTGAAWSANTLRDILIRPRNAGRMVYQGEVIGTAPWEPIVAPEVHDRVVAKLTDPARRTTPPGSPLRWLGSGIFRCGRCGASTETTKRTGRPGRFYRCSAAGHVSRQVELVDALVVTTLVERITAPDVATLLAPARPDIDPARLHTEATTLRGRLNELAEDYADGLIDREQLRAATKRSRDRLAEIDATLAESVVDSPLAPLLGAEDVAAAWEALPLTNRRTILDALLMVTILPAGAGRREFDPASVRIEWRQPEAEQDIAA